jgi:AcrR family transcriptional regulator
MMTPDEKRALILDKLADHVLAHGLSASSLRPLAKAAGTSDRMLLYYFTDKGALIAAVLQHIAERMVIAMEGAAAPEPLPYEALLTRLSVALSDPGFAPYMRVFLEVASGAANGDTTLSQIGEAIGRGFLDWGKAQLQSETPDIDAARLMVTLEGTVFLRAIGMGDVCRTALGTKE